MKYRTVLYSTEYYYVVQDIIVSVQEHEAFPGSGSVDDEQAGVSQ
jgi:hypothetical protein